MYLYCLLSLFPFSLREIALEKMAEFSLDINAVMVKLCLVCTYNRNLNLNVINNRSTLMCCRYVKYSKDIEAQKVWGFNTDDSEIMLEFH